MRPQSAHRNLGVLKAQHQQLAGKRSGLEPRQMSVKKKPGAALKDEILDGSGNNFASALQARSSTGHGQRPKQSRQLQARTQPPADTPPEFHALPHVDHAKQHARLQNLIAASRGMLEEVEAELTKSVEKTGEPPSVASRTA